MNPLTIHEAIRFYAESAPDSNAIIGVGEEPITYKVLYEHILRSVAALNQCGIGRQDCTALVLPNGPMLAAAFLSTACASICAPLNPGYTEAEFDFYLSDLNAKALLVPKGNTSPAVFAAAKLNIPVMELSQQENKPEGLFTIQGGENCIPADNGDLAKKSDDALILHTSGTTSRPKIVPLTQKNLCSSAMHIMHTLGLTPADRCLNVMPLFHIHGLMAAVLASMMAGASVACTPGFLATEFYKWLDKFHPTWYTAVPTMHQSILSRARQNGEIIRRNPLRFVRSSSSSLAPVVMNELEGIFNAPVIEAYGMTEASHQMASNPLPPGERKPGSVGRPAGPDIAIMAEDNSKLVPQGEYGEIVIRGPNVTLGYRNNPEANKKSFTDGWFRTGDQGFFDGDGYLYITGRLKEIINRGGEKISPREVDEVLLEHPAVAQAVTFGMPDPDLGEEIAAAVVLSDPQVTDGELRRHAAARLAPFKVPARIIRLEEIPKGSTGKIQRIGLAAKLGLSGEPVKQSREVILPPRTETEGKICSVWMEVLDIKEAGVNQRFRDLGGDSMLATLVHLKLESIFNCSIPLIDLFGASTIAEQAGLVDGIVCG